MHFLWYESSICGEIITAERQTTQNAVLSLYRIGLSWAYRSRVYSVRKVKFVTKGWVVS